MVPLVVESWLWWSIIILCVICRMISRLHTTGSVKRLQADDYITLVGVGFYTCLIIAINIASHTDSNLLPPGFDVSSLTPSDIRTREFGSKLVLLVEQCQCVTIWCEKLCLLILYQRLTIDTKQRIAIKILLGYVVGSFVIMEILYFGVWCRPFTMYWAVPTRTQCSAATHHLITNATFNLSSDVLILSVALPMFIKTRLPLRKKIAVVGIFSLGTFVIIAAILNKVYSFTQPFGADWTFWYVRESSTAILTANAAFIWALVRRIFHLRSLGGTSKDRGYSAGYTPTYTNTQTHIETLRKKRPHHEEVEMDMDLLMPDPEHGHGIHREIEIQVTEDSRRTSTSTKHDESVSSKPAWMGGWDLKEQNSREGLVGGERQNGFATTHPQMPPKAIVRTSQ